jgi:flagellar motor switch protein FliM
VIRLGQAKLHVSELLNLRPGDVVVLDQRVSEPLSIEVCGTRKYVGWPGRVGNRQAFQIQGMVEDQ